MCRRAPQLWPAFEAYLAAGTASGQQEVERSAQEALREQLQGVESLLPNSHPYVGGAVVCAEDCALAPRLYLARQGCRLLKVRRRRVVCGVSGVRCQGGGGDGGYGAETGGSDRLTK